MKTNKIIKKIVCIIVILIVLLNTQSQIFAVDIIADKNKLTKTTEKSEILEGIGFRPNQSDKRIWFHVFEGFKTNGHICSDYQNMR